MRKKIIHIYSQYYFPISNACSNRVEKYILALKDDYEIKVITGMPNYPTGVKDSKYKWKLLKKEIGEYGEQIIRTYEFASKNEGSFLRLLNYVSFMVSSFIYGLFTKRPDIIIVTSPPLFTAIGVLLLNKIKRIPYILEIRDLWPDSVVALGFMKKDSYSYKLFSWLENKLYKNAKHIIGVTKGICNHIEGLGINKDKIILQYNVAEVIDGKNKENPYLEYQDQIKGRKIFLFAGNMNEAYDFDYASKYIFKNKDLFFFFIGDGSMKRNLIADTSNCKNIIYLDRMSYDKVQSYIYHSHGTFIPLQNDSFFQGTMPVKGIEAIVNNKEIIFIGPNGEFQNCLDKYNKGEFNNKILTLEYFKKYINGIIK